VQRREVKARPALVPPTRDILDGCRETFQVIIRYKGTGNVIAVSRERKRIVAAWMCLFAVVALHAPLAGAAWSAHAMSCCTGDHCPIARHQHQKKQDSAHSGMDCEHDLSETMDCSMSCCNDSEKPLVTAVAFVLPIAVFASASISVTGASHSLQTLEIPRSLKPPSPPPRYPAGS
jgi:hypothetical protein